MARFVKFPGTAGSYASTDDVNLLDADTAHIQQSVGHWEPANEGEIPVQSPLNTTFGDFSLLCESLGTGPEPARTVNEQTGSPAVTVGNQYTVSYDVTVDLVGYEARAKFLFRDAGTGNRLEVLGTYQPLTSGVPLRLSVTATAPAVSAYIKVIENNRNFAGSADPDVGDKIYVSSVSVAEGSSSAFVPSLRIVGDLDIRATLALPDWTPAATEMVLAKWNSGGFTYEVSVRAAGFLAVQWAVDQSTFPIAQSSIANTIVDGTVTDVRWELEIATGTGRFYIDDVQLGVDSVQGASSIDPSGTSVLEVGSDFAGAANNLLADVFTASVRDGIDGPIVAVFDADDIII